ncbi:hypothetical protein DIPPA_32820 [Diplonema papillatum]|nr:hypothetical protein DIPPA_32820 [Diplonema papillatum]
MLRRATKKGGDPAPVAGGADAAAAAVTVLLEEAVGDVRVLLAEADIARVAADAVVNAANEQSFTPMDCGVSGALRNACLPANVCGAPKLWVDDRGEQHATVRIPTTFAGTQPAAGGLAARGVQHIVHAVGPIWSDYPVSDKTFSIVVPKIRRTVKRALSAAAAAGARSCAVPAVSGGIFTHYSPTTDIKRREQLAARRAVSAAVLQWAATDEAKASELRLIYLVDLSPRKRGYIDLFCSAFKEACTQPAAGGLAAWGVQHIVHAVGPIWSDYPVSDKTFGVVVPKIRRTVKRALSAAAAAGARSCAVPAVSGGIFTHYSPTTDIKRREQLAARRAVSAAVLQWAAADEAKASELRLIYLVDLSPRKRGYIDLFRLQ